MPLLSMWVEGGAAALKFDLQDRHFFGAGITAPPHTGCTLTAQLGAQKSGEARKIATPRFVINGSRLHCSPGQAMTQALGQIILAHFVSSGGSF